MFGVDQAPRYVAETAAAMARLQEMTSPGQYAALVGRAERLLDGMFTVERGRPPPCGPSGLRDELRERCRVPSPAHRDGRAGRAERPGAGGDLPGSSGACHDELCRRPGRPELRLDQLRAS